MPFHLAAFDESQDSATLVNVAALADRGLTINGDDLIVPDDLRFIAGVCLLGSDATQGRLLSPSLRRFANLDIAPINIGVEPDSPTPIMGRWGNPIELDADEALNAQAAEGGSGAKRNTVLVWLSDGPLVPVSGDIRTLRFTGTDTLVANVWSNGTLTAAQTLPSGVYACVGARAEAAGLQAFRFVPVGAAFFPGGTGHDVADDMDEPAFRNGMLGEWFQFDHNRIPSVDYLSNSTDTAETVWMDLIKVA